jgi:3-keto-disaccharide hydrolase
MIPLLVAIIAQTTAQPFTSPASAVPEYGHGLTAASAKEGWIALFDGQSNYGWRDSKVDDAALSGGQTTGVFHPGELQGDVVSGGTISIGDVVMNLPPGKFALSVPKTGPGPIKLGDGIALKSLCLKPETLKSVFNGKDLTGWKVLPHPRLPAQKQTRWTVEDGILHAVGGPGALELEGRYGDVIVQVEVRMRAPLVNGGLFFRSIPGEFLNGYEAQLFNGCYQRDPAQPARYSTGAIDDRLLARRLVSRDLEPFTMTVIAVGPHIATWVNGYQAVDWTDTRKPHANPREGLRLEPGTIQLQAHDPETDIEFLRVAIGEIR